MKEFKVQAEARKKLEREKRELIEKERQAVEEAAEKARSARRAAGCAPPVPKRRRPRVVDDVAAPSAEKVTDSGTAGHITLTSIPAAVVVPDPGEVRLAQGSGIVLRLRPRRT